MKRYLFKSQLLSLDNALVMHNLNSNKFLFFSTKGNYKDIINMKESSRMRLEALREATLREEQEFNDLLAAEKHEVAYLEHLKHANNLTAANRSKAEKILDEIFDGCGSGGGHVGKPDCWACVWFI